MVNSTLHAKARESEAEAVHARVQADIFRDQADEGRIKLAHANEELAARVELAALDRELAQDQLDALEVQLQAGSGDASRPR